MSDCSNKGCDACTLTTVYSSPSVPALESLVACMSKIFNLRLSLSDMFWFGVFCHTETYANFGEWGDGVYVPEALTGVCTTSETRSEYVDSVIDMVMRGEIERPEWMEYVEMNAMCAGQTPSTFLRLEAKDEKYACMADALIQYLYSPSKIITMVERTE